MSAKRRRKNSAHNWRWLLRAMLSHDEAQDTQKSIVDAHYEFEETRESCRNTHIQDTVNVYKTRHQLYNILVGAMSTFVRICARVFLT